MQVYYVVLGSNASTAAEYGASPTSSIVYAHVYGRERGAVSPYLAGICSNAHGLFAGGFLIAAVPLATRSRSCGYLLETFLCTYCMLSNRSLLAEALPVD